MSFSRLKNLSMILFLFVCVSASAACGNRSASPENVYIADEAFFTGTAAEVTPIRELDGRVIGAGKRGPITEKLQTMYFDQVKGRRAQFPEWLTPVQ